MQWEIINTPEQPKCIYCFRTTNQMLICHRPIGVGNVYICSNCARFVKDAMNKWEGLKSVDYIDVNVCNPFGTFREPIGKDLTLDKDKDEYYSADFEPDK